jgi:glycosyltransferase involved in cell wall biosynthesis
VSGNLRLTEAALLNISYLNISYDSHQCAMRSIAPLQSGQPFAARSRKSFRIHGRNKYKIGATMIKDALLGGSATPSVAISRPREFDKTDTLPAIVLVLATYIPESYGGAEQQSRKLALAFARLGMRVSVLAPRLLPSTPRWEREGSISLWRFRLRKAPNLGGRHIGSAIAWGLKLSWWMVRHRREYDVIHIFHGRLHALPAVLTGCLLRKPTLIKIGRGGSEHFDLDVVRRKRLFGPWYARTLVRHADAYVANSQEIVADLRRWGVTVTRIHQIPNGVDICADYPRLPASIVRFVYLGRLDPEKAIDLMIRGFARLADRSRVLLVLVGDGDCRRDLERLVDQLHLRDCISFKGAVQEVSTVLTQSDIYVSTSLSEGMSNALLEAMSFGVMPLVSRVSGVSEIVDDGQSGLLFAPGDLDAFTAKLEEALALAPETRQAFAALGRARVAERFGIDQIARRHVALYRQLISRES